MNKNVNNALLDLVVKTANDLAKHHSDTTLELVSADIDERFDVSKTAIDGVVDLVADVAESQTEHNVELNQLVDKVETSYKDMQDLVSSGNTTANDNFNKASVEIDVLKAALGELAEVVDSEDTANELTQLEVKVGEVDTSLREFATALFKQYGVDLKAFDSEFAILKESLSELSGSSVHVEDHIKLSNRVRRLSKSAITSGEATNESIEELNTSVAKLNEDADKICSDWVASVSELNKKIATLTEKSEARIEDVDAEVMANDVAYGQLFAGITNDIKSFNERVTTLKSSIVGNTEDIASLSLSVHADIEKLGQNDDEFNEAVKQLHSLISATDYNINTVSESIAEVTTALSEQFSELRSESFLSSDKIDMKFAEMQLGNVEADVKRNEILRTAISEQGESIQNELDDSFKEYRRNIGNQVEASNKLAVDNVAKLLENDKRMVSRARQWVPGTEYGADIIARNLAGLWQAVRTTTDAPTVKSQDWQCLSSSFHSASVLDTHANGVEVVIGMHDSLGKVHELTLPGSRVRYLKGVYQESVEYDHLDSIMKDGCRWVATKDKPSGVPGEDDADWQVLTMRGPKGMKGSPGERGPKGLTGNKGDAGRVGDTGPAPEMDDIVKAVVGFESEGGSQPIRRARGLWQMGNTYASGDVVNVGQGLFVCLIGNNGTQTPGTSTEDWLLLLQGGSSGTINTAPSFDIEHLPAELVDVADTYPVDVDTVEADELQVRLQLVNRPAGNYVASFRSHHNLDSVTNSVYTRYSTDGGATWMEVPRESKDVSDEIMVYSAFPIAHPGGDFDIVLQLRKENVIDTLIVRHAEIWLDAKFV